jgi:hypothetical protein
MKIKLYFLAVFLCFSPVSFADGFKVAANWEAFNAGNIDLLDTKGYYGAVSDGRYIYYTPCRSTTSDFHGRVLRYDTLASFTVATSYAAYDAGSTDGLQTKGYAGAVFDERYVYFVPYANMDVDRAGVRHARVLRYDTQGAGGFQNSSSWAAYDASGTTGIPPAYKDLLGYDGAVYDGTKYVYFVPYGDQNGATNTYALRYDTDADFKTAASWTVYDITNAGGSSARGYYGAAFDGTYVYYVPYANPTTFHGLAIRYNTTLPYTDNGSWSVYDASSTGMVTVGYKGAVFDGRYVYYVPFRDTVSTQHTRVLRYDTQGVFTTGTSWAAYDAQNTESLNTQGYVGAECDGTYVYFIPYENTIYHANVLRYDRTKDFQTGTSWAAYNAGATSGLNTKGYKYSTKQGDYLYFVPYNNNIGFSGIVLRYKWNNATPVYLVSFTVCQMGRDVLLQWETASEVDCAGFHLWRSERKDAGYQKITTAMIASQGGASWGAKYSYTDFTVMSGKTYYYKLQDVDYNGKSNFLRTVAITVHE